MANEQNLKPWKPGQSGNPAGYSTGRRITDRLIRMLEERHLDDTVALILYGAATDDQAILKGRKPNFAFFKELLDRVDGPVPTRVEADVKRTTGKVLLRPGAAF